MSMPTVCWGNGNQVAMTFRFDLKDTEAVFFKVTRSISRERLPVNCCVGICCKTAAGWEFKGAKWGLPIMMHQRFNLAFVKVANLFQ